MPPPSASTARGPGILSGWTTGGKERRVYASVLFLAAAGIFAARAVDASGDPVAIALARTAWGLIGATAVAIFGRGETALLAILLAGIFSPLPITPLPIGSHALGPVLTLTYHTVVLSAGLLLVTAYQRRAGRSWKLLLAGLLLGAVGAGHWPIMPPALMALIVVGYGWMALRWSAPRARWHEAALLLLGLAVGSVFAGYFLIFLPMMRDPLALPAAIAQTRELGSAVHTAMRMQPLGDLLLGIVAEIPVLRLGVNTHGSGTAAGAVLPPFAASLLLALKGLLAGGGILTVFALFAVPGVLRRAAWSREDGALAIIVALVLLFALANGFTSAPLAGAFAFASILPPLLLARIARAL